MGVSKPQEEVPAYEELYEQRPSNPLTGYSRVADAEEPDTDPERDAHQHDGSEAIVLGPQPLGGRPHIHCEECDRQLERRENRQSKERCCAMVFGTIIVVLLFLMIFGIVAVAKRDRY